MSQENKEMRETTAPETAAEQTQDEEKKYAKLPPVQEKKYEPILSQEQLRKGLKELPPYLYDSIKDRLDTLPLPILEALATRHPLGRKKMIRYQIPFNRHEMRKLAIEAIYQHLLLGKDIKKAVFDVMNGSNQIDGYLYSLTVGTIDHEEEYKKLIESRLRKDWPLDRMSLLEQAILLMSTQELLENQTPKAVVINEAVTLAKEYCDDSAPKLINAVLDTL